MTMAEWWEAAKSAVATYTGMTPAAFFTAVAVSAALYVAVSGLLARPAQLGEVTEEELRAYDGSDPKKPLLMAIKGQIYDVTQSRMFYGPGGPYASFAGRDASRALAKMSFEPNDLTGDISGLGPFEVEALQEWEYKFKSKYVTVGTIKKTVAVAAHTAPRTMTAERDINESTIESNHGPEPTDGGDASTISHEDVKEKTKELTDLEVPSASIRTDAVKSEKTPHVVVRDNSGTEDATDTDVVEKTEETSKVVVRNNNETEEAAGPKGTPQVVDEKNGSKPEDATEKPKEALDAVDMNNTASNEDAGQSKEIRWIE